MRPSRRQRSPRPSSCTTLQSLPSPVTIRSLHQHHSGMGWIFTQLRVRGSNQKLARGQAKGLSPDSCWQTVQPAASPEQSMHPSSSHLTLQQACEQAGKVAGSAGCWRSGGAPCHTPRPVSAHHLPSTAPQPGMQAVHGPSAPSHSAQPSCWHGMHVVFPLPGYSCGQSGRGGRWAPQEMGRHAQAAAGLGPPAACRAARQPPQPGPGRGPP